VSEGNGADESGEALDIDGNVGLARTAGELWQGAPGSSGKQATLLHALTRGLDDLARVEPWTTSFNPGTSPLERLLELTREVDFAAFVFAQDDWTTTTPSASSTQAGPGQASPRDNVVFEAGLFGGVLGMRRFTTRCDPPASTGERILDDMSILDGRDDQRRAALIAERLTRWKSVRHA
jgi:hypothetical protein